MKKKMVLFIILGILLLFIIGVLIFDFMYFNQDSPVDLVNQYMKRYQNLDSQVVNDIVYDFDDSLTEKQQEQYVEIMKRQYENLTYEISESEINGTDAIITVQFEVYDLSSAMSQADSYVEVYHDKFVENDEFDVYSAIDYKLQFLISYNERITYSVKFAFYKENRQWKLTDLSESDLKKIRGTY